MNEPANRRPLKSRGAAWAQALARRLAGIGASPDLISLMSLVFAAAGALAFAASGRTEGATHAVLLVAAGVGVQLRLLCNLLDGMVAVEHGRGGPLGPLWNELPDRLADVLLLVGAGYGAGGSHAEGAIVLGWVSAVLAVLTAYVRELGRALGFEADFSGPGAKPHRMAVLTATAALGACEPLWGGHGEMLFWGLALIAGLTGATVIRRTLNLARALKTGG